MNRSLKNLVLLPLLLLSIQLFSQLHYQATPFNSAQVAAEITNDFGHLINISSVQLNTHLAALVDPNSYCPACPGSTVEAQQVAANTLLLKWNPVANAAYYEIRYLNLTSGFTGSIMEMGTSATVNNLPNGPYAFSLVTNSNGAYNNHQSGFADIVILETPMVLDEVAYNCECVETLNQSLAITSSTITWFPELNRRYLFNLDFLDGTNTEVILLSTTSLAAETPMKFSVECAEFLYHSDGSNTFFSEGTSSDFTIHLTYDDQFYFEFESESDANPLISATLTHCAVGDNSNSKMASENLLVENRELLIYPNPSTDVISIVHTTDEVESGTVTIFDAMGRQVAQMPLQTTSQLIDISELPVGRYELEVRTEDFKKSEIFIKIK